MRVIHVVAVVLGERDPAIGCTQHQNQGYASQVRCHDLSFRHPSPKSNFMIVFLERLIGFFQPKAFDQKTRGQHINYTNIVRRARGRGNR